VTPQPPELTRPALSRRPARAGEGRLDDAVFVLCGLAWGSGLIHVVAAFDHVDEYALYAVFFALLAPLQFAWGLALYRRPTPWLLKVGAVGSVLVALLWAVSRTSGLPIGPEPWTPEAAGAIDVISTADELLTALIAASLLTGLPRGAQAARAFRFAALAAGVLLILLSSLSPILNGHSHAS
jgi:hypothetical protein